MSSSGQWRSEGPPVGAYVVQRRSIGPKVARLVGRLVMIAIVVTGLSYLGEWARTEMTATDDWYAALSQSGQLKVQMPERPEKGTFMGAQTLRAADEDWEVLLVEAPPGGEVGLAQLFGNTVSDANLSQAGAITMDSLGGQLGDVRTFRHRLGRTAVEFHGTYRRDGVERYLKELVVISENGTVLTLKVEADSDRDQLVDYLYREVEASVTFT